MTGFPTVIITPLYQCQLQGVRQTTLSSDSFSLVLSPEFAANFTPSLWAIKRPGAAGQGGGLRRLDLDKLVPIHKPGVHQQSLFAF